MTYIFRYPADTPEMTYGILADRLRLAHGSFSIGSTVRIMWGGLSQGVQEIMVRLYDTTIAILASDGTVRFPNDDPHQATSRWIEKIVRDNGIGWSVGRVRRRKSDGPGPQMARGEAGLHVIDWGRYKPVHGRVYQADPAAVAARKERDRQWAAEMEAGRAERERAGRLHNAQWELERLRLVSCGSSGATEAALQLHEVGMLPLPDDQSRALYEAYRGQDRFPVPDVSDRITALEAFIATLETTGVTA